MRKRLGFLVALVAILLAATSALAAGKAQTFTQVDKNVTETFVDVVPCSEPPVEATITITYNSVFHVTELADGTFHATFTQTGSVTAVAENGVTYSGRFTVWGGFNLNRSSEASTFTFSVRARGSDRSRLNAHMVEHFSMSASGHITTFARFVC
jgi:hypothetical protein